MKDNEKTIYLHQQIIELKQLVEQLRFENTQLKQLIFGSKKERFVSNNSAEISPPLQGNLFAETPAEQTPLNAVADAITSEDTEKISYERKKSKHKGRNKIPSHLPVEEIIVEPDIDTTGMKKIGEEVTETLEYTPASLIRKITRYPKYAFDKNTPFPLKNKEGQAVDHPQPQDDQTIILIADRIPRPIPKGIAEASLLAHIFIQKFIDHLPFYRQRQIFKRNYKWDLSSSTINDWFIACCTLLKPLYEKLVITLLENDYLQADESPIKVLETEKKGSTTSGSHQGYMWVYRSPTEGIVVFQYRKGRGAHGPKEMLATHEGYLQTDGYVVYDKIAKSKKEVLQLVGCWAHARRKFFEALKYDQERASYFLEKIKTIYLHDRQCRQMDIAQRQKYRIEHIAPLMNQLHNWAEEEQYKVLPKTPIGKAMGYLLKQWEKLRRVLDDERLELDNNKIENKIRPLALGRKNYLFAGNHRSGQHIAMMYSFFATCKEHNINPYDWLKDVLEKLPETKISDLVKLLPQNWSDANAKKNDEEF